jgi:hypothetical protein
VAAGVGAWVGAGGEVGVAGSGVAEGNAVAVEASVAEAGNVGGTSVAGAGETARAIAFTVGVPSTVTLTVRERLKKKNATAMTTISTPNASAIHGQRFDGSPGSIGSTAGGGTLILTEP